MKDDIKSVSLPSGNIISKSDKIIFNKQVELEGHKFQKRDIIKIKNIFVASQKNQNTISILVEINENLEEKWDIEIINTFLKTESCYIIR